MRKFLAIAVLVIIMGTAIFVACKKESKETSKLDLSSIQTNPYDFIGRIHNKGMNQLKDQLSESSSNVVPDVALFTINFMQNEIVTTNDVASETQLRANITSLVNKVKPYRNILLSSLGNDSLVSAIDNSNFTTFQKQKIKLVLLAIDQADDVQTELLGIEADVLNSTVSDNEKAPVLCVISIAKYSCDFWIENSDLLGDADGPTWRGAGRADAGGAIIGLASSISSGALAGSLVFGPGGIVLTLGGAAVGGALWSSGLYLVSWGWF